jgi:arylsulfatase
LNAEEEPESYYYPKDPAFHKKFGPRGVIHSYADGKIEDTGPLTRKRMETVDSEFGGAAKKFMASAVKADKPFFVWMNFTRMHVWTRLQEKYRGITGIGLYPDGMAELDDMVGSLLDELKEFGVYENTIVIFSTDNGAEKFTWPDGGTTPYHGEKGTTWEGSMRVPQLVKWPGSIKPRTIINDTMSQEDWLSTLLAAAGVPDVKEKIASDMWLMVPAQGFVQSFFDTIADYPFQPGGSLSASNIGYGTIERQKALGSLKKLMDISIQN